MLANYFYCLSLPTRSCQIFQRVNTTGNDRLLIDLRAVIAPRAAKLCSGGRTTRSTKVSLWNSCDNRICSYKAKAVDSDSISREARKIDLYCYKQQTLFVLAHHLRVGYGSFHPRGKVFEVCDVFVYLLSMIDKLVATLLPRLVCAYYRS